MVLSTDLSKLKKHISITACSSIAEIMKERLSKFSISNFNYYKIYSDNSIIRLSSNLEWTEHFFNKNYLTIISPPSNCLSKQINYFVWLIEDCPLVLTDAYSNFDLGSGLTIAIKDQHATEYFCFELTKQGKRHVNLLLNHLDVLQNDCSFFKEKAKKLLATGEKNKIIPVKSSDILQRNQNLPSRLMNNTAYDSVKLSLKQSLCANLLIQGLTTPQIAQKLQLSPRTIETHINQLKYKFGAANKSELLIKLVTRIDFYK